MKLHFLDRECGQDKLDTDHLLVAYLITICSNCPGLWKQFKEAIETAEQYVGLLRRTDEDMEELPTKTETVNERIDRLDAEYREALKDDNVPAGVATEIRREREELLGRVGWDAMMTKAAKDEAGSRKKGL